MSGLKNTQVLHHCVFTNTESSQESKQFEQSKTKSGGKNKDYSPDSKSVAQGDSTSERVEPVTRGESLLSHPTPPSRSWHRTAAIKKNNHISKLSSIRMLALIISTKSLLPHHLCKETGGTPQERGQIILLTGLDAKNRWDDS